MLAFGGPFFHRLSQTPALVDYMVHFARRTAGRPSMIVFESAMPRAVVDQYLEIASGAPWGGPEMGLADPPQLCYSHSLLGPPAEPWYDLVERGVVSMVIVDDVQHHSDLSRVARLVEAAAAAPDVQVGFGGYGFALPPGHERHVPVEGLPVQPDVIRGPCNLLLRDGLPGVRKRAPPGVRLMGDHVFEAIHGRRESPVRLQTFRDGPHDMAELRRVLERIFNVCIGLERGYDPPDKFRWAQILAASHGALLSNYSRFKYALDNEIYPQLEEQLADPSIHEEFGIRYRSSMTQLAMLLTEQLRFEANAETDALRTDRSVPLEEEALRCVLERVDIAVVHPFALTHPLADSHDALCEFPPDWMMKMVARETTAAE